MFHLILSASAPSGPPLYLTYGSVLSRSIQLAWNPPSIILRNGNITGYTVSVQNTETNETREWSTDGTSLTVTNLTPYVSYMFTVAAHTAVGQGPLTPKLSISTAEDGNMQLLTDNDIFTALVLPLHSVPSEPQSPSTERVRDSPRKLRVSWQSPAEPNGVITLYTVYCYQTNGSTDNIKTAVVAGTDLEAIVEGVTPYTFYNCNVTANTSIGEGPFSKTTTARTDESGKLVEL